MGNGFDPSVDPDAPLSQRKPEQSPREKIAELWAQYTSNAGAVPIDDQTRLQSIRAEVLALSGKDKTDQLTDDDYLKVGLKKSEVVGALSRTSMEIASRSLETTLTSSGATTGKSTVTYEAISSLRNTLKDTEYFQKGGMAHAINVACSLSPHCGEMGGISEDSVRKSAEDAAKSYVKNFKEHGFGNNPVNEMQRIETALTDAGLNPKDDNVMKRYVGMTGKDFEQAAYKADDERVNDAMHSTQSVRGSLSR